MAKQVVILGAGFAGIPVAHKLFKYTAPNLSGGLKIVLVAPNSHFYWNNATPRALVPNGISDKEILLPIEPAFARYSSNEFEFVLGKAQSIDLDDNAVVVTTNEGTSRRIPYDQLVIATGSSFVTGLPFTATGTYEEILTGLHAIQKEIASAKDIVVAGGGPSGVETAGEILAAYHGKKKVTLVINGDRALSDADIRADVGKAAEKELRNLGAKLIHNTKVTGVQDSGSHKIVSLSNGETLTTDVYLPLFGTKVNTSFVPQRLLDSKGSIKQDLTLRVSTTENVWAIGDVGSLDFKAITVIEPQILILAANLDAVLRGKSTLKNYQPASNLLLFVALGKTNGAGQMGGWKVFKFVVSMIKGKKLFLDKADGYVSGKHLFMSKV